MMANTKKNLHSGLRLRLAQTNQVFFVCCPLFTHLPNSVEKIHLSGDKFNALHTLLDWMVKATEAARSPQWCVHMAANGTRQIQFPEGTNVLLHNYFTLMQFLIK